MRYAILVLAALALVVMLLRDGDSGSVSALRQGAAGLGEVRGEQQDGVPEVLTDPENPSVARARVEAGAPGDSGAELRELVLEGVVTDLDHRPLGDVAVRLSVLSVGGAGGQPGAATRSQADGSFRLRAPAIGEELVQVEFVPGPFHALRRMQFGAGSRPARARLTVGTRDLGQVTLGPTGSIAGRVLDAQGLGVAGARVAVGPLGFSSTGLDALTDDDGSFTIPHAAPGKYPIRAVHPSYLAAEPRTLEVEAGQISGPIELQLDPAPSVQGQVVGPDGVGMPGVRLSAWSDHTSHSSWVDSGPGGRFELFVPAPGHYQVAAEHPDFDDPEPKGRTVEIVEGARPQLRIELQAAPRVVFCIVDHESGEALESFGLEVLRNNGPEADPQEFRERRRPAVLGHADGRLEAVAHAGLDLVVVCAPGYQLVAVPVAVPGGDDREQFIRLPRGASLRGRVVSMGAPQAGVSVELVQGRTVGSSDGSSFRPDRPSLRSTLTDSAGVFRFEGLMNIQHQVTVRPAEGAPVVLAKLRPEPPAQLDLGDLEWTPGGAVEGRVLLPAGFDPANLRVQVGEGPRAPACLTDAGGAFRVGGLAPGPHRLSQGGRIGQVLAGEGELVQVRTGETSQVVMDLSSQVLVPLDVNLDLGGLATEGLRLSLVPLTVGAVESYFAGTAGADGSVRGFARPGGPLAVELELPGLGILRHPEARWNPVAGETLKASLRWELVTMDLELTQEAALQGDGVLSLSLRGAGYPGGGLQLELPYRAGGLVDTQGVFVSTERARVVIRGLVPGAVEVELRAKGQGGIATTLALRTVDLVAGARARLAL